MPATKRFHGDRVIRRVEIPRIKEFCPNQKIYLKNNTIFMIYRVLDHAYPDIVEITENFLHIYDDPMIKCYVSNKDTADIIEKLIASNINERENLGEMIKELSLIKDLDNKKIDDVYEKYKNILGPACLLYKFCYYWVALCVALDIRIFKGVLTVIHRSLAVRDGIAYAKGSISKEEYGKSWEEMRERVGPTETITDMKYVPVEGYVKELTSDVFTHKKGQTIPVKPHGKIVITRE